MKNIIYILILCHPISLLGQYFEICNNQWDLLIHDIKNDSIVCLGEESHWVETYLEIKNSLIKTLHKKKQFNVIIFESGIVNSFVAYKEKLNSKSNLTETLYNLWQTKSTLDLINYIDQSQNTNRPIVQLGCDLKGPKSFRFSRLINKIFKQIDHDVYGEQLRITDSTFIELRYKWEPKIGKANKGIFLTPAEFHKYKLAYNASIDSISSSREEIIKKRVLSKLEFEFLKVCIKNRLHLLNLMQLPTYQEKHKFRDSIMAENSAWLIKYFMPNRKYIIWGADIHISKNAKWEEIGNDWIGNRSMIECLMEKVEKKIFSIGIKPKKSISKKLRRKLKVRSKVYYLNLVKFPLDIESKFKSEHEALIICGKIKGIKNYRAKTLQNKAQNVNSR